MELETIKLSASPANDSARTRGDEFREGVELRGRELHDEGERRGGVHGDHPSKRPAGWRTSPACELVTNSCVAGS